MASLVHFRVPMLSSALQYNDFLPVTEPDLVINFSGNARHKNSVSLLFDSGNTL